MAPVDCVVEVGDDSEENDVLIRARLANSLSQSFPSSLLSQILHTHQAGNIAAATDDDEEDDLLSSSCFAELCQMKKEPADDDDDDDELTCLDWLQDINLLQSINPSGGTGATAGRPEASDSDMLSSDLLSDGQKENASLPTYDPVRNLTSKPPYSFSVLIFMAIEASPRRRLPVKDIYNWIAEHFPYYRRAPVGWRNSVRHNLSLNKCFRKVEKSLGKGSSWCIDPLFRPNLLQAMKRTPYYPFQQLQMSSCSPSGSDDSCLSRCYYSDVRSDCESKDSSQSPSSHSFPLLNKRIAEISGTSADDIDVANTLASLGDVNRLSDRERKLLKLRAVDNLADVIRTPPPSTDHSYGYEESLLLEAQTSASPHKKSIGSPVDEKYEFDDCDFELTTDVGNVVEDIEVTTEDICAKKHRAAVSKRRKSMASSQVRTVLDEEDAEEERKRLEGVNALLNLAANSISSKRATRVTPANSSSFLWARAISNRKKKSSLSKNSKKIAKKLKQKTGKRKIIKKL